ncbi:MAG: flavodoxin family protein [Candidatus Methanomethylophilaceae archaeon]|nr:flavodoxin family protein [Candidatus Methanomethylophilaceae archaeon]
MKKLLMINGSPRKNGSDTVVCDAISEMAKRYDYESETVYVNDLDIKGCQACMACKKTGKCVQKDCMNDMIDRLKGSDMVLFAMPVYFGAESAQMKTFIDRLYPIFKEMGTVPDMGKLKKASVVATCGAPDGHMTYGSIISRYMHVLKSMGIVDVSGAVLPGAEPENILEKEFVQDFLSSVEFQLEM